MPFKTNAAARGCILVAMLLLSCSLFAQKTVTGKILSNADNQPLAGASIQVKGTKVATQTGTDGSFSIAVPKDNSTLVISSVGFQTQEISLAGRTEIGTFGLSVSTTSLNDVIVTGYTTQKKKDITGAVAVVDVKALKQVPGGNPDQLLQGQASGVQVISSGQPGMAPQINVRGISSFGNNNPLYIIDGTQGDLHDINPNDIESIQVLKDAGSAAIYGVQGANGVIVITTKRGKSGKSTIAYDGWVGTQRPKGGNPLHLLNSPEMLQLTKNVDQLAGTSSALYGPNWVIPDYTYNNNGSSGIGNAGDPAVDPSKYVFTPDHSADYLIMKTNKSGTDWFHEIFKPAFQQSHNIAMSGGSDKSSYLFSFNYLDQNGTLIANYLKRYSVRINSVTTVKNHVRVGENGYFFYKSNPQAPNQWENSPVQHVYTAQPLIPVYDIKGNYAGSYDGPNGIGNGNNPVADMNRLGTQKFSTWDMVGNVFAEVDFLKHFTARTQFGGTIDNQYFNKFAFEPYEELESHSNPNGWTESSQYTTTWLWTNTLAYSNVFAEKHSVKVLAGYEAKNYYQRGIQATGTNLSPSLALDPNYWALANVTANYAVANNFNNAPSLGTYSVVSAFGRVDYAFEDKYLLAATFRQDKSSVLAPAFRTGNFPSVSAGWRISGEEFMKSITWITDLKIRGSWGKLGQVLNVTPVNAYNTFGQSPQSSYYDINGTSTSSQPGYLQTQVANLSTTWEQDVITNIGFDGTFFNNKFDLSAEWFDKESNGLLALLSPPAAGVGFATYPQANAGKISNKGIDISATYHGVVDKDLKFNIGVNFTHYKATVKAMPSPGYLYTGASRQGTIVKDFPGAPFGAFYGYKITGLYRDSADMLKSPHETDAAPGRFKYADLNGDDTITAADQTVIGNPNPKFTYGINLNATYKNWDFTMILYGSYGNQIYNYTKYWTDFYGSFQGTKSKDLLYNSWTPTNLGAKTPRAELTGYFSTNNSITSYYIESGSFLKCRSIQVGYTIPGAILSRVGIDKFRLYVQAVNPFMVTKYSGIDPELLSAGSSNGANPTYAQSSSFGIDYGNYPNNQRSYIVGVSLTF